MVDIYSMADRIIIWPGPEQHNSTKALSLLHELSSEIEMDWAQDVMKPAPGRNPSRDAPENELDFKSKYRLHYIFTITNFYIYTDPRDRIYALMGLLASGRQGNVFKLDYSKRTAQLYQEAFMYMVRQVESLNVIERCMLSLKNPSGPTWVPNLNAAHPIGDFALSHASGDAAPEMRLIQGHEL
ncbi:hypothetical protein OEA41_007636 [Lepraria neglecta]|uniref:Uncharacterized protein n=1 Tax=Lepraria neglecta TaxID=209136 RepID=A0AAD9ZD32_9LECA|nr:hypothetical protein OEA41_007636 [Lepraria neglecta]